MKRFSFNLEKVLELRTFREDEARAALSSAAGVMAVLENSLKSLAAERSRAAAERLSASDIFQYDLYLRRLDADKERILAEAAQAALKVEAAKAAWIEASREKKVLDKLKEKRLADYRRLVFAEETKNLDDLPYPARL